MEDSLLVKTFGATPRIRVIDYLIENLAIDASLQDICEGTGLARNMVSEVLKDLLEIGIIDRTRMTGRAKLFALDRKNSFVKHLLKLDFELSKSYSDKFVEKEKITVRA